MCLGHNSTIFRAKIGECSHLDKSEIGGLTASEQQNAPQHMHTTSDSSMHSVLLTSAPQTAVNTRPHYPAGDDSCDICYVSCVSYVQYLFGGSRVRLTYGVRSTDGAGWLLHIMHFVLQAQLHESWKQGTGVPMNFCLQIKTKKAKQSPTIACSQLRLVTIHCPLLMKEEGSEVSKTLNRLLMLWLMVTYWLMVRARVWC